MGSWFQPTRISQTPHVRQLNHEVKVQTIEKLNSVNKNFSFQLQACTCRHLKKTGERGNIDIIGRTET